MISKVFILRSNYLLFYIRSFLILICFLLFFSDYTKASDLLSKKDPTNNLTNRDDVFSFVVWGHPRGDFGQPPLHFEEILERLSELKPDILIVTGDAIEGGNLLYLKNNRIPHSDPDIIETINKDWDRFDTAIKNLGIPYYITPGNHDVYSAQSQEIFYSRYPKVPFAITFKGSRFILLDPMGTDKISKDVDPFAFTGAAIPFDEAQTQFIRNELLNQEKYRNLFFFMHPTELWANSDGWWWRDIHPMLRGGKTRAVFSGNTDGYRFKYQYVLQDDIYYIQSSTYPLYSAKTTAGKNTPRKAMGKQFDNFQYVKVDGDDVQIRTIVVGATSSNVRSRRYWDKVDAIDNGTWQRRLVSTLQINWFSSVRKIFFIFSVFGGLCFLFGIILVRFWKR